MASKIDAATDCGGVLVEGSSTSLPPPSAGVIVSSRGPSEWKPSTTTLEQLEGLVVPDLLPKRDNLY